MKKPAAQHPIDPLVQRRLTTLERLIDTEYEGSAKVFEARTGIKMAQVGQWFTGYRALRDKALRRLEGKTRKPLGYFDAAAPGVPPAAPPAAPGPRFNELTADERALVEHFRLLLGSDRRTVLADIGKLAAERKAQRDELLAEAGIPDILAKAVPAQPKR